MLRTHICVYLLKTEAVEAADRWDEESKMVLMSLLSVTVRTDLS